MLNGVVLFIKNVLTPVSSIPVGGSSSSYIAPFMLPSQATSPTAQASSDPGKDGLAVKPVTLFKVTVYSVGKHNPIRYLRLISSLSNSSGRAPKSPLPHVPPLE